MCFGTRSRRKVAQVARRALLLAAHEVRRGAALSLFTLVLSARRPLCSSATLQSEVPIATDLGVDEVAETLATEAPDLQLDLLTSAATADQRGRGRPAVR